MIEFSWEYSTKNILCTIILILVISTVSSKEKLKRQLFRDQVIPFLGGKIPESAFHPERLLANRLNKNGIYSKDGIYFQERDADRYHMPKDYMSNTIKIIIPRNNLYVAQPGRFFKPEIIDTTYLITKATDDKINEVNFNANAFPLPPIYSLNLKNHYNYLTTYKKSYIDYDTKVLQESAALLKRVFDILGYN